MSRIVQPKVFYTGVSKLNMDAIVAYLEYTGNTDFLHSIKAAKEAGVNDSEILCSMFGKLCYKSLTLGQNANVTRIRDIPDNFKSGILAVAHGSVLEHAQLNFIITDCSRVFTHELVRHRVGTAFSQTSGRYVRIENLKVIVGPDLIDYAEDIDEYCKLVEDFVFKLECKTGLRIQTPEGEWVPNDKMNFDQKKKLTSSIRRFAPNGQANEIALSLNLRALRHILQIRTARSAEWEIRAVFGQVYGLLKDEFPLLLSDAKVEIVDGLPEITGMKAQPYA